MLLEYLDDHVKLVDAVESWEDSIKIAAQILVDKKYITNNYIDAMIENVKVNGPYVVIMPNVAMPHSRPEDGVIETTASLMKLNKPVVYPEDKAVSLIIVLAAVDGDKHLELIADIADLLTDSEKLQRVMASHSVENIIEIIGED